MSIVPTWPIAVFTLALGLGVGVYADHTYMKSEIHERDLTIANMKTAAAVDVSKQSQEALSNLTATTRIVKEAAQAGQVDLLTLSAKLDTLNRKYNAKPPAPLPVDCKPGTERVQHLAEGAAAIDATIARPVSSK